MGFVILSAERGVYLGGHGITKQKGQKMMVPGNSWSGHHENKRAPVFAEKDKELLEVIKEDVKDAEWKEVQASEGCPIGFVNVADVIGTKTEEKVEEPDKPVAPEPRKKVEKAKQQEIPTNEATTDERRG